MRRSPKNVRIAFDDAGLTHYGGVFFFHEFMRVLQFRRFASWHLDYPRRNQRYSLPECLESRHRNVCSRYASFKKQGFWKSPIDLCVGGHKSFLVHLAGTSIRHLEL